MAKQKVTKRRLSQQDKENKLVTLCLRRRLAWCNRTGSSYDPNLEQYSTYPRGLSDESGVPHTGSTNIWMNKLKARYSSAHPQVYSNTLLSDWNPECVIIDAMAILNTKPLRSTKSITTYSQLLCCILL